MSSKGGAPLEFSLSSPLDMGILPYGNELYVRFDAPVSRVQHDLRFDAAQSPNQTISIPTSRAGTYYILVYSADLASSTRTQTATVLARSPRFSIASISPERAGNAGNVTLTISGFMLSSLMSAWLVPDENHTSVVNVSAIAVWSITPTTAYVTFSCAGLVSGSYFIALKTRALSGIELHAVSPVPLLLRPAVLQPIQLRTSPSVFFRPGTFGVYTISLHNTGDNDVVTPVVRVNTSANAGFRFAGSSDAFSSEPKLLYLFPSDRQPAGVYPPGTYAQFSFEITGSVDRPSFGIEAVLMADTAIPLPLATNASLLLPQRLPSPQADQMVQAVFANLLGHTMADLKWALSAVANNLSAARQFSMDFFELCAALAMCASNDLPLLSLDNNLVVSDSASSMPGGAPLFYRRLLTDTVSRTRLGVLGASWSHNWESRVESRNDSALLLLHQGIVWVLQRNSSSAALFVDDFGGKFISGGPDLQGCFSPSPTRLQSFCYFSNGSLSTAQQEDGTLLSTIWIENRLASIVHPTRGPLLILEYDLANLLMSMTDVGGRIRVRYEYATLPFLGLSQLQRVSRSSSGDAEAETVQQISYTYNADGLLASTVFPDATSERRVWTEAGVVVSVIKCPHADFTSTANCSIALNTSPSQAGSPLSRVWRDPDTDGMNHVFRDSSGGLAVIANAEQQVVITSDANGEPIAISVGEQTHKIDCSNSSVCSITAPDGGNIMLQTNVDEVTGDRNSTIIDARGIVALSRTVNANRSNVTITYPDGTTEVTITSSDRKRTEKTKRSGGTIVEDYTEDGLLLIRDLSQEGRHVVFSYEPEQITGTVWTESSPRTTTVRLAKDTLTSVASVDNCTAVYAMNYSFSVDIKTLSWSWYADSDSIQASVAITKQPSGDTAQVEALVRSATNSTLSRSVVAAKFDHQGSKTTILLGNGVVARFWRSPGDTILALEYVRSDHEDHLLFAVNYTYNSNREMIMTELTLNGSTFVTSYEYDSLSQLTAARTATETTIFQYDLSGNRLFASDSASPVPETYYKTNVLNQYTQMGDTAVIHDLDGRLIALVHHDTGDAHHMTNFSWNQIDQLAGLSSPNEGDFSFAYDAFGNLDTVTDLTQGLRHRFAVDPFGPDGMQVMAIRTVNLSEDTTAAVVYHYIHSEHGLHCRVGPEGDIEYYAFDAVGNIIGMMDESGQIIAQYQYDAFGRVTVLSESGQSVSIWRSLWTNGSWDRTHLHARSLLSPKARSLLVTRPCWPERKPKNELLPLRE